MDARTDLERVDAEWARAAAGGDVEEILSYWADDAVVLPPGAAPVTGKDAIRAYVAESLATPGFRISWETEQFTVAGDLAYGVGTNSVTFPAQGGELVTMAGKVVTVWRKQADGWKCVIDIWNEAPAP